MNNLTKTIALFLLLVLCNLTIGQAQTPKEEPNQLKRLSEFKTWTVQCNLNISYGHTDIAYNELFYDDVYANLGYGFRVSKYLSPHFALSADFYKSSLHGFNYAFEYNTEINYQTAILAQFQTGPATNIDNFKNFQLYGYVGYGKLGYEAELINSKTNVVTNYSSKAQVIPVGFGIKYKLKDKATINFEYVYNKIDSDLLDGYRDPLTDYDYYSRFQIGISTNISCNEHENRKSLEW